ncbi:putative UDP-glucuronate:xylan alpha-glucuronosyltransferase 5 [Chenopodium quinoa]|uniref:putative UDP-glucuronate:xylan alpha-glucuronosyltransferase 5 n=1 Tax=Chenopodium quinoa TaxID=63459 RepID=UPI000B798E25|nr:putative UDP-glucuronate:xylan alpha-glucuronosyltransferase 5 [Chenopodium quinoa]
MSFTKLGQQTISSKRRLLTLILLFVISFPLLFLSTAFFPNPQLVDVIHLQTQSQTQTQTQSSVLYPNKVIPPKWLKVILETHLTPYETLKVGLVNFEDLDRSHLNLDGAAKYVHINIDPVSSNITWEKLFPEWIDETNPQGWCPEIPMPKLGKYSGLDVVVAQLPCKEERVEIESNGNHRKAGTRDVDRLQISLATAHLIVENGINSQEKDIYAVFIANCDPMLELFRCDDLLWHGGEYWVYKPNIEKLKEMVKMPVGSCALAHSNARNPGSRQLQAFANELPNELQALERSPREAYVTVLHSSEDYVCGAIALAQSILQTNTTKDLILLADRTISRSSILGLQAAGWKIKRIDRIKSPNAKINAYNEWNYSKLRIWQLIEYDKLIFIDSDFIVLRNIDHLFGYPQLSAAPNDKWLFNSGIMVLEPSKCFFDNLMSKRYTFKSYNGGDQGYLNEVITWWHRLTLKLNFLKFFDKEGGERLVPEDRYTVHFLGTKPWLCYRDYDCNWDREDYHVFASDHAHAKWWQVYDSMPKKLHKYCKMTRKQDKGVRNRKSRARKAKLSDGHWKIELKDPRQYNLVG